MFRDEDVFLICISPASQGRRAVPLVCLGHNSSEITDKLFANVSRCQVGFIRGKEKTFSDRARGHVFMPFFASALLPRYHPSVVETCSLCFYYLMVVCRVRAVGTFPALGRYSGGRWLVLKILEVPSNGDGGLVLL